MDSWNYASLTDKKLYRCISVATNNNQQLLKFIFDPQLAKLRLPPDQLLKSATGFCTGDYLLVKFAVDLWSEHGCLKLHELFNFDDAALKNVLSALAQLRGF